MEQKPCDKLKIEIIGHVNDVEAIKYDTSGSTDGISLDELDLFVVAQKSYTSPLIAN